MGVSDKSKNTRRPARDRMVRIALLSVLGAAILAYVAGVVVFSRFLFLPGTTLEGEDVSLKSVDEVASERTGALDDYVAQVTGDGVDVEVRAADIGLAYDGEAYAREAIAQTNAWLWPAELTGHRSVSAKSAVVFDRDALLSLFQPAIDAADQSASELKGSAVVFDEDSGAFALDPTVTARYLDKDALLSALSEGFTSRSTTIELGPEQLSSDKDDLLEALDAANAYLGATGTSLTLDGEDAIEVTAADIAGWVSVSDDLSVSLDEDAVSAWVKKATASLDTVGAKRTYTRADGKEVTVEGGSYGWEVDSGETASELCDAVEAGEPAEIELPYSHSAEVAPDEGGRDWGNRYIDIDLTEQHVRMYGDDGSVIFESDCVTGDTTKGYGTPTGVNQINDNMGRDQTLYGLDYNKDGEPDYESHVSYWMPFVSNLIALHDAGWRGSFGGTVYKGNGSHGCVNLPLDKAAELYELVEVGDVVVVHY